MIAGILDWTKPTESIGDLRRMQEETGPFPMGQWDSCIERGSAISVSALEETGASGLAHDFSNALTVVFHGVLYNRDELIQSLGRDYHLRISDADLVVGAYGRWGCDLLDHLNGDFALA